jgi:cytochrome c oxidase subunit 2
VKKKINKIIFTSFFENFFSIRTAKINFLSFCSFICDAPDFWQLRFQDPASSTMEGILMFNKHLLFIIVMIIIVVGWLLFNTIYSYDEFSSNKTSSFFHSNELEIIWTSLPALTLLTLASPSFSLLYSMDEISIPDFSIKVLGHQWFWSYEISDFRSCLQTRTLKYACYMLGDEELRNCKGFF